MVSLVSNNAKRLLKSLRDDVFVALRTARTQSSFRSDIAVPPINGLIKFREAHEFYKYFVPTGLVEETHNADQKCLFHKSFAELDRSFLKSMLLKCPACD